MYVANEMGSSNHRLAATCTGGTLAYEVEQVAVGDEPPVLRYVPDSDP